MAISTPEWWGRGHQPTPPSSRDLIPSRALSNIYFFLKRMLTILDAYNFCILINSVPCYDRYAKGCGQQCTNCLVLLEKKLNIESLTFDTLL